MSSSVSATAPPRAPRRSSSRGGSGAPSSRSRAASTRERRQLEPARREQLGARRDSSPMAPSKTTARASSTTARSASATSARSWVTCRMPCPAAPSRSTIASTSARPSGSSIEVGSSSTRYAGLHRERARDREPLLLAAGEQVRLAALEPGQPDRRERVVDPRADLVARQAEVLGPERDVVFDGWSRRSGRPDAGTRCRRARAARAMRASSRVSMPSTVTVPACGSSSPLASRASVDLPEPFAPRTATCSPGRDLEATRRQARDAPGSAAL